MEDINENRNYCVYIHTSPSGKKYVGQTGKKPEKRWGKNGAFYLNKRKGHYTQPAFAHAILKYGWNNFKHEIIKNDLTKAEANDLEILLIRELNTANPKYGYNCTIGGEGCSPSEGSRKRMSESHKGVRHTDETKKKISESLKGENNYLFGKHLNENTKKKISEAHKGKILSEKHKNKISEAIKGEKHPFYGKHHTEEAKKKISEANKVALMGTNNPNAVKVSQYDLDGNLIKIWDCMSDAGRKLGLNNQSIYDCCKGNRKTYGGFIWRYYGVKLTKEYLDWCNESPSNARLKRCVAQYSLSGEFIRVFESMTEAELKTSVLYTGISMCCNGKRKTAGGFIWKYYEKINDEYVG